MHRGLLTVCATLTTSTLLSGCTSSDSLQLKSSSSTISDQNAPDASTPRPDFAQSSVQSSSGDDIQVWWPNGAITCSITYISKTTGLTAGHCGEEGAAVYSHGNRIGTISVNYLLEGFGLDIAEIVLLPDVGNRVQPIQVGEHNQESAVFTNEADGQIEQGKLLSDEYSCQRFSLNERPVFAYVQSSNLKLSPGDSGAPIYSSTGKLVALGQGGDGEGESTVTPLSLLDSAKSGDVTEVYKKAGWACDA